MLHRRLSKDKPLLLLLTLSLLISTVPTASLFAQTPAMNLDTAAPVHRTTSMDAGVACDNLSTLAVNHTLEQSVLRRSPEAEWIKFTVQKNARYRLQVNNAAGLELALYDRCNENAPAAELRNGQLEFTATRAGEYYLLIKQDGVASASVGGYQVTLSPAAPHRPSFTPLADVPEAVLRRATEFLEELRDSDLAPEWQDARVNPQARVLYRPDMQEPAYYEFSVEKPIDSDWEPAGYIQLSAGEHDYPIANWNMTGMSTTQELAELAPLGATLTEIYRLNAESYAAEYEEFTPLGITTMANDVVKLGELPNRIEGLEAIPEEPFELVTQSLDSDGNEGYEGPAELPLLEENPWESWAALKAGYEEEYGPLLASLEQRASDRWELVKNLGQYGETLIKGDVRTVYGLAAQTISSIQVTGDGADAQYLQQEQLSDGGTPTGVKLTVLDEPADPATLLSFEVALQYTNGTTETLKYAIANEKALNFNEVYLPFVGQSNNGSLVNAASAEASEATSGSWGPWHYYWVDSHNDALRIRYNQIPRHSGVNTSACYSGCAATGWAMAFAWVDRRAAENHWRWRNHWGIYRVNGGLGANAVAPTNQDAGVNNMTWEIRNHLRTSCSGTSGSTSRSNEIRACEYVRPRATASWGCRTRYDPTGLCWFGACNGARDLIRDQIVNLRAPAIVGANSHIQMAVGYAYQSERSCFLWWCSTSYNRWFYVNKGWGGSGNGWLDWDDVYLGGIYYPG